MQADLRKRARIESLTLCSRSLTEFLERDPAVGELLDEGVALPDGAGYRGLIGAAFEQGGLAELRRVKRARLMQIAALDLAGEVPLEIVTAALADLADACLHTVLAAEGDSGMAVVAMGKLGGRELNYVSDIDVMFVTAGDVGRSTKVAGNLLASLGGFSPEGRAYELDTNLRPEGRNGALVRTLDGYLEYYKRWAKPWEFQALIKARHVCGNPVGEALVQETRTLVFPEEVTAERIAEIRRIKERVEQHAAQGSRRARSNEAEDVKLGPGGIRDIEFSVQLLQLVHGGSDPSARSGSTLAALEVLSDSGYIAEDDAQGLEEAYRWLRSVEHRLQLWQERRVRHLPADEEDRSRLGRSLGLQDSPERSAADEFDHVHNRYLADVRGRFEKLFYRPMVEALSESTGQRLSEDALKERLHVLGFRDVERAARTLGGLLRGTTRQAKLFRVLTPAFLRFLANSPMPDEGLFSFLRVGEALGGRVDVLGALRDNPPAIEAMAKILGSGRLLGDVLLHVPEEIQSIADLTPTAPKERDRLQREAVASLSWREAGSKLDGLRRFKRREMLRVASADIVGEIDAASVGTTLADLADACLAGALHDLGVPLTVVGMGKLGGRELNYSSDIDVMFLHDTDPATAEKAAEDVVRAIGEVTPEGQAFRIDAALRPEGKSGPLARSLESYIEYYDRWAQQWEFQALIKVRIAAGDDDLGGRFLERARELAFPNEFGAEALAEARHLKARMEKERIPRGTDPRRHLKMGPGGLADIEFAVQLLQRRHGRERPELQVRSTLDAIDALRRIELLDDDAARVLADAYAFLMRLRNRLFLMVGRPVDALPVKPEDLEALGVALGFREQPRQEVEETYLRHTRRARRLAEPLIFG